MNKLWITSKMFILDNMYIIEYTEYRSKTPFKTAKSANSGVKSNQFIILKGRSI